MTEMGRMIRLQLDLNVGDYQGMKCKKVHPRQRENKGKESTACLKISKIVTTQSLSVKGESHY